MKNPKAFQHPKPWFRIYREMPRDPKIITLHETFRWRFIHLLCLKCEGTLLELSDEELAADLRIDEEELKLTKSALLSKGLIQDNWDITNWSKRQFESDLSTSRVHKHRQKVYNETFLKRRETVSETLSETETDTETEKSSSVANATELVVETSIREKFYKTRNAWATINGLKTIHQEPAKDIKAIQSMMRWAPEFVNISSKNGAVPKFLNALLDYIFTVDPRRHNKPPEFCWARQIRSLPALTKQKFEKLVTSVDIVALKNISIEQPEPDTADMTSEQRKAYMRSLLDAKLQESENGL